eukprot:TRINITY_DN30137_c0_g1_i1.p1 TRINITY_DN30137_c0_g1~~TRINITY_DN30137_c0_g1_i1.p1  ORF type:complete len:120 (+),score=11.15 TRINITY_DN30137_c0_g1_i1:53-412(+)
MNTRMHMHTSFILHHYFTTISSWPHPIHPIHRVGPTVVCLAQKSGWSPHQADFAISCVLAAIHLFVHYGGMMCSQTRFRDQSIYKLGSVSHGDVSISQRCTNLACEANVEVKRFPNGKE